tara:strand:+ start:12008 stop:14131 length:2124 start_codon:yes stop_codon:yes gene_type:complete
MKHITFKKISITNFLSFGKETSFDLNKGVIAVITGYNYDKEDGNGVGKSSILDAFFFALFGETLKDLKKDQIVNDIAKKGCQVVLEFEMNYNGNTTEFRIERGISPSFCRVYVDGENDETLSTIPVVNKCILNILNSTPTVFKNTITMRANNTIPFMSQKRNEKREFVEGILRLEVIKLMSKYAKENYSELMKDYAVVAKLFENAERNIDVFVEKESNFEDNRGEKVRTLNTRKDDHVLENIDLKGRLTEVDPAALDVIISDRTTLNEQSDEYTAAITVATREISAFDVILKLNNRRLATIAADAANLKREYATYPKYDNGIKTAADCDAFIEKTQNELLADRDKLGDLNRDILDHNKSITQVNEVGASCETCKRPFPDVDVEGNKKAIALHEAGILTCQSDIKKLKEEIEDKDHMIAKAKVITKITNLSAEKKVLVVENEINESGLTESKSKLDEAQKKANGFKDEREAAQTKIDALQKQISNNQSLVAMMEKNLTLIENCDKDVVSLKDEKNEFSELLSLAKDKRITLLKEIEKHKESVAIYDVIKHVVSDEGLKSAIVKKLLGVLNEKIAYYLDALDANCQLSFDEYFEDNIINDKGNEAAYANFSNGEQKRIDLACLFAFMDLRRIQGDVTFNLAFYDELLDSALSVNGSSKVFDILDERKTKYSESAFVVTHKKENLKNPLINDIIFLEKSGGITRKGEYKG